MTDSSFELQDCVIVPIDLFKNSEPIDVRLYCELDLLFGTENMPAYIPHDEEFAGICKVTVKQLKESIERLNDLGWLQLKENFEENQWTRRITSVVHYKIGLGFRR